MPDLLDLVILLLLLANFALAPTSMRSSNR